MQGSAKTRRRWGVGLRWSDIALRWSDIAPLWLGAAVLFAAGLGTARGQVLAQKNWAGSGVTVEVWWRRAVFYRIDPAKFQDSKGDGRGDLAGVIQRLDYVQSLGVDALIVESASGEQKEKSASSRAWSTASSRASSTASSPSAALAPDELDGLVRAAVGRHLRVLVELGAPASQQADAQYLALARAWLNQGAAGLYVPTQALEQVDGVEHIALLLRQLRAMTDSFPGERVLLADAPRQQDLVLANALAKSTQLTASEPLGSMGGSSTGEAVTAARLRAEWMADLSDASGSAEAEPGSTWRRRGRSEAGSGAGNPFLMAVRVPAMTDRAQRLAVERALAAMLLGSRSAVLLEYGQELGLEMAGTQAPLMQWTPTNLTRKPPPKVEPAAPKPEKKPAYAGFQPFVRPLPRDFFTPPVMPVVVVESFEPEAVDVAALPGFTAGDFDAALAAGNGATANVALETEDAGSLLNLYRQLIQMHHDNATVRSGSQAVLDRDAEDALVWVRRAPASSRTSTTVVMGCNLSGTTVGLGDVGGVRLEGLRSLLNPAPAEMLTVAPGSVVVEETR